MHWLTTKCEKCGKQFRYLYKDKVIKLCHDCEVKMETNTLTVESLDKTKSITVECTTNTGNMEKLIDLLTDTLLTFLEEKTK